MFAMKQKAMAVLAVSLSLVLGVALAEVVFRLALPPVPGDDDGSNLEYLKAVQRSPGAPRLFPPDYSVVFDIRGLYEGAETVAFHVGPHRFIAPEPARKARYEVLFLGGSVTEGMFLPDAARWPGRLGDGDEIATYNAGMSEAGMLSQYITATYLAERGDRFDLVVLATNHNDSAWSRRFADVNSRYRFDQFSSGLATIYEKDYLTEHKSRRFSFRTLAWAKYLLRVARMTAAASAKAPIGAAQSNSVPEPPSMAVAGLLKIQGGQQNLPKVELDACNGADSPRKLTDLAFEDWKANLPEFRSEMKRLLGAELLVVSEPSTYGAPSSSFHFADMRVPLTCATSDGLRAVEARDAVEYMKGRGRAYLEAARLAGAMTFDLADVMASVADGPQGGAYFFDSIHPTPKGAEKFADYLRPALEEALASIGKK
jgi:hypothetical protein